MLRPGALRSCARSTAGIRLHQRGKSLAGGARLGRCPAHADCLGMGLEPAVTGFRGSLNSLRASRLRRARHSVAQPRRCVSQLTLRACRDEQLVIQARPRLTSRRSLPSCAGGGGLESGSSSCPSGAQPPAYLRAGQNGRLGAGAIVGCRRRLGTPRRACGGGCRPYASLRVAPWRWKPGSVVMQEHVPHT